MNTLQIFAAGLDPNAANGLGVVILLTAAVAAAAPLPLIPMVALKSMPILSQALGIFRSAGDWLNKRARGGIFKSFKNPDGTLGRPLARFNQNRRAKGVSMGGLVGRIGGANWARKQDGVSLRQGWRAGKNEVTARHIGEDAQKNAETIANKLSNFDDDMNHAVNAYAEGKTDDEVRQVLGQRAAHRFADRQLTDFSTHGKDSDAVKAGWQDKHGNWVDDGEALFNYARTDDARQTRVSDANDAMRQAKYIQKSGGARAIKEMALKNITASSTGFTDSGDFVNLTLEGSRDEKGDANSIQWSRVLKTAREGARASGRQDAYASFPDMHLIGRNLDFRLQGATTPGAAKTAIDEAFELTSTSARNKHSPGSWIYAEKSAMKNMARSKTWQEGVQEAHDEWQAAIAANGNLVQARDATAGQVEASVERVQSAQKVLEDAQAVGSMPQITAARANLDQVTGFHKQISRTHDQNVNALENATGEQRKDFEYKMARVNALAEVQGSMNPVSQKAVADYVNSETVGGKTYAQWTAQMRDEGQYTYFREMARQWRNDVEKEQAAMTAQQQAQQAQHAHPPPGMPGH